MAKNENGCRNMNAGAASGGGIYFLAFIGSFVYYATHAVDFWQGFIGFFKALVWPAIVAYNVFNMFNM